MALQNVCCHQYYTQVHEILHGTIVIIIAVDDIRLQINPYMCGRSRTRRERMARMEMIRVMQGPSYAVCSR